jgi:hypothetical protein
MADKTAPPSIEIARIEETVRFSTGGTFALLGLIAVQFLVFAAWSSAKSAVQEASLGTLWIALNVLLGIGVIVGRRRTYRVLRDADR